MRTYIVISRVRVSILPWGVPQPGYKSGGGHRTDRQLWAFLERFQTVTYLYGPG